MDDNSFVSGSDRKLSGQIDRRRFRSIGTASDGVQYGDFRKLSGDCRRCTLRIGLHELIVPNSRELVGSHPVTAFVVSDTGLTVLSQ
jgi:hypothetical protein